MKRVARALVPPAGVAALLAACSTAVAPPVTSSTKLEISDECTFPDWAKEEDSYAENARNAWYSDWQARLARAAFEEFSLEPTSFGAGSPDAPVEQADADGDHLGPNQAANPDSSDPYVGSSETNPGPERFTDVINDFGSNPERLRLETELENAWVDLISSPPQCDPCRQGGDDDSSSSTDAVRRFHLADGPAGVSGSISSANRIHTITHSPVLGDVYEGHLNAFYNIGIIGGGYERQVRYAEYGGYRLTLKSVAPGPYPIQLDKPGNIIEPVHVTCEAIATSSLSDTSGYRISVLLGGQKTSVKDNDYYVTELVWDNDWDPRVDGVQPYAYFRERCKDLSRQSRPALLQRTRALVNQSQYAVDVQVQCLDDMECDKIWLKNEYTKTSAGKKGVCIRAKDKEPYCVARSLAGTACPLVLKSNGAKATNDPNEEPCDAGLTCTQTQKYRWFAVWTTQWAKAVCK